MNKQLKSFIKKNRYLFEILNYISLVLIFILNVSYKKKILEIQTRALKFVDKTKVLFIYSKEHFEPSKAITSTEYSGTYSWSKFFYEYLRSKYDSVEYIDLYDFQCTKINKNYKLIIGVLSWSFVLSKFLNRKALHIYIAVNAHPIYRNRKIIDESKKRGIGLTNECVNPILQILCYYIADVTLLAGNEFTKKTYLKYSPNVEIISISGGILYEKFSPDYSQRDTNLIKIFYPTSFLGIRKGIFSFFDLLDELSNYNFKSKLQVTITGKIPIELRKFIFDKALKLNTCEIIFSKWLSHEDLVKEIQSSNIVVSCSLEEGQPHGVLEAIAGGCIPFVSVDCGIDLNNKFIFENDIKKSARKLSEIITRCEADSSHKLSQNFINILKKNNNWNNVITKINNFF